MSEFPEPQQKTAAAYENKDIGPFRKGPKQITTILTFIFFYKSRGGSTQFLRLILSTRLTCGDIFGDFRTLKKHFLTPGMCFHIP